ncbi:hypothetical protein B0T17DRAFT_316193 [Bombardia bombarda]|uniref:Uncharacterized protein n=1 Tax=Bombardia bombarda TaxID=252184 RepID=A0AA39WM26_9PEZI|nr:hypothetical protein B0T17DRAFT_316193 [Bombardia bombarda]
MDIQGFDWAAGHEKWAVPVSPTHSSLPTMNFGDDFLLDFLPTGPGGQLQLADLAPSINTVDATTNANATPQLQVSELFWRHEPDIASTNLAPSTTYAATPSSLAALAGKPQECGGRPLPSQALHQLVPRTSTVLPSSNPQHRGEERTECDDRTAKIERLQATTPETRGTASEPESRTGAMLKHTSVSPSRVNSRSTLVAQLPSPDSEPSTQASPAVAPQPLPLARLATATPNTTASSWRNADIVASQPSTEVPGGKRRYRGSGADPIEGGEDASTTKRPK